ncbi:unnamed protein product [Ilex paraguariensis]|uniref:Uncharacterized protein n=1 Tax=Ilex paraguariensis TaxID=185542 RepID=A0ABC8RZA9_9AQUA
MSWLNLRRLSLARKVWKVFTTKLQRNLNKLNRSKLIKKPKNPINNTSKTVFWPFTSHKSQLRRQIGTFQPAHTLGYHHHGYLLQKRSKPVYIDQLFVEPVPAVNETTASKAAIDNCSTSANKIELINQQTAEEDDNIEKNRSADELWESLMLASPQMHGINERAEEFIARFRAEMQLQEMLNRHL